MASRSGHSHSGWEATRDTRPTSIWTRREGWNANKCERATSQYKLKSRTKQSGTDGRPSRRRHVRSPRTQRWRYSRTHEYTRARPLTKSAQFTAAAVKAMRRRSAPTSIGPRPQGQGPDIYCSPRWKVRLIVSIGCTKSNVLSRLFEHRTVFRCYLLWPQRELSSRTQRRLHS